MTPGPRSCSACGRPVPPDAPGDLCPSCALRRGLGDDAPTLGTREREGRSAPTVEVLGRRFPELEDFALIGPGGMGTVYRATHRGLERPVAVKVLHDDLRRRDASFAERFAREARTLARLDHPNIVRVYDFGQREESYYLVMELVDGVTLRQTMTDGRLTRRRGARHRARVVRRPAVRARPWDRAS